MPYITGSKNIKDLLLRAFADQDLKNLAVLDFPAGSGFTSHYLETCGAKVTAWDMFPEFFKSKTLTCTSADLQKKFPALEASFDMVIFQEGIEHLPDQLFALKEFHRILKDNSTLIVTTPNYSNLRSRLAYLLFESETPKIMPPNELEYIWFGADNRIYMGHIFSIGIMRLRLLATLAGFELVKIHPARINWSSFILSLPLYPFILLQTLKTCIRAKRKLKTQDRGVFFELFKLNLNPDILLGGHLIVQFKKLPNKYEPSLRTHTVLET